MSTGGTNITARTIVRMITVIVVITTLTLMFLTEFPIWGGLIITLVILVPCQAYLNRTKPKNKPRRISND